MTGSAREVVIVGCRYDLPAAHAQEAERLLAAKADIWEERLESLSSRVGRTIEGAGSFDGLFYPSLEDRFPLEGIGEERTRFLLSSERITLSLFQPLLGSLRGEEGGLLVSAGSAQTDQLAKSLFMQLEPELFRQALELLDPLGYLKLLRTGRAPALETVSEASSSGAGSLLSAYNRIRYGQFSTAVCGGSCAATLPLPYELSAFGFGDDRLIQPFEQGASGHYYSEGGAAFVLKEKQRALADGDPILAEIRHIGTGAMGSSVVNRNVMKKLIAQSLEAAGMEADADIMMDLYGRGNEIDDSAELSFVRNLRKSYPGLKGGFLKQDVQYVVGYYGLMGLCRLLEARQEGGELAGRKIETPNRLIGAVREEDWTTEAARYTRFSIPVYSMHGNAYHLLIDTSPDRLAG
ncbi:hypothetical protein F4V43_16425 [Paenibacillus spiritus]|uniref:Ketosynthase family 3 (KS3) domain-containing protein n=1 Tax=Paenibacillus spiritus TaxID=2496557 RepID=A0A5J5FXI3_9BACL|nr:beta-ketoacyl synthase N-terminal-like domain-containing protein [Paenibacillus spiritus]KAA8998812.1 hypothetical protein F4V43_16425 [Paenibacillus spiritus]